jgi:hypothetical protein
MSAKPRKRRDSGDLCQLRVELWAGIRVAAAMVDDPTLTPDLKLRAVSALATAASVYAKLLDEKGTAHEDVQDHVITVDVSGNGHHTV